ncbi:thymidine kinase [Fredinandcohnia humi]
MKRVGKLVVNVGSMFSGKSSELLRQGRRYELMGKRVLFVKPSRDKRYSESEIVTHDKQAIPSISVRNANQLRDKILFRYKELDALLIDEVQFFDELLIPYITEFIYFREVDVIVSGLDMDRFGVPFGIVPQLMAIADEVHKFKAICGDCGNDAYISHGEFDGSNQVVLGAKEKYTPLCRACYFEKTIKRRYA